MQPFVKPLEAALGDLQKATMWFMQNAMKAPDNAGAGSYDFMHLFGLVQLGYMWAKIAKAVHEKKKGNGADAALDTKLTVGRFYMERMLPETSAHLARIQAGANTVMALPAEAF
jgi:acyl-CoA dehydrogenase